MATTAPERPSGAGKPLITARAWMITFTDLAALLLAFFVLLFSMSTVRPDSWQNAVDSLSRTLSPTRVDNAVPSAVPFNIGTTSPIRASNLDYLATVLREAMREDTLLSHGSVLRSEEQLVLVLPGDLLFESGRSELPASAVRSLAVLGGVLGNVENQIGIHGHTDPQPVRDGPYRSNWELSLARAATVADALRDAGYDRDIIAYGFADSRYHRLPDIDEERRQALARRVDIVILPTPPADRRP